MKYLVTTDSILTFVSQYKNLEIYVVDSTVVDTVVLEKQSLSTTGWANISTLSNATGAVVTKMIPTAGINGAIYYLELFGEGYFRLRMTDVGDNTAHKIKVKVVGRP
jgi:uncharacterized membrane protein